MLLTQSPPDHPSFRRRIAHPKLQTLYDLWLTRRGDRIAMLRADLDPTEIPRLLPCLILSDVGDGGRAIRYRLVGTEIVAAHGFDYTGKTIEELTSGETLDFTRALYGTVVTRAVPVYSEGRFRWAGREYRWTKRLHLPLTRDGTAVDMVLSGQVFEEGVTTGEELLLPATAEELAADRASES
jgi:hypothetical protein